MLCRCLFDLVLTLFIFDSVEGRPVFSHLTLKSLKNIGSLGQVPFYNDSANLIQLEIVYQLSCYPEVNNESDILSYIGVNFSKNQLWVGVTPVKIGTAGGDQVSCYWSNKVLMLHCYWPSKLFILLCYWSG